MQKLKSTITKDALKKLYYDEGLSMQEIAISMDCSLNRINYWMKAHGLERRSRADAGYLRKHPDGDPFLFVEPSTPEHYVLYGVGLGLYWGEGNKANKNAVRLGNTDARLIIVFMQFLEQIYSVSRNDMKFGLQIFSDMDYDKALVYWLDILGVSKSQFYKVTVTISGKIGNYRNKNTNGVLTVYYHNTKLRNLLNHQLNEYAAIAQLVERKHGKFEVSGSNPGRGSTI